MRQLVVNADDFGLTRGITNGIIEAHRQGIVTSTSIMAPGRAFDYAVEQAHANPNLGIGIHLTLVEELAIAAPQAIPTLVAGNGRFPANYAALLPRLLLGRIHLTDVAREFRAQIEKCLRAGLRPDHLDSHQHVHALPSLFRIVAALAHEYKIGAIRFPRDSPRWRGRFPTEGFAQKYILALLARYDARMFGSGSGQFESCQGAAGIFDSGVLSEDRLLAILDRLPDGRMELVCHPGTGDAESLVAYGHWRYKWRTELQALTSRAVRDRLQARQIQVTNYRLLDRRGQ